MVLSTLPGRFTIAPLVPAYHDCTPDTLRTRPYTFTDLQQRWQCSADSVEKAVRSRFFKIGHTKMVRPSVVLQIECAAERG